ncbi:MAG: DUF4962 domain-containing protein [bacterium]
MRINQMQMLCLAMAIGLSLESRGQERASGWMPSPEMRLPVFVEVFGSVVRTVAKFDFTDGPQGWLPRHPDVKISCIHGDAGDGGILRLMGNDPSHWNFAVSPSIVVEPGHKYRASMRFRIESSPKGSRPIYFKVELVNDDKSSMQVNSPPTLPDKTGQWLGTSVEFVVPPNCHGVWAAIEKGSESPASIDLSIAGFTVEEIREFTGEAALTGGQLCGPITASLAHVHPRLYMNAQFLRERGQQINSDPRWAWARRTLFRIADAGLRKGPPDYSRQVKEDLDLSGDGSEEQLWQRNVGNMIPHLALAYLLSHDQRYLDAANQWILASLSYKTWGLAGCDGLDLAAGHQLAGIGLAYDWLYADLTPATRAIIRQGLQQRAGVMARAVLARQTHWQGSYMQNHLWVNCAGLATAGFALCDEVDEARGWIRIAHEKFLESLTQVGVDGASQEGYGYWEYGTEAMMRYMELAHDLLGINLYESRGVAHPGLELAPLSALYLALPRGTWTERQSLIDIGDCPRTHWYGPSHILHNLARRYPFSSQAGLAQWLARQTEEGDVDAVWSSHYLNLLWSDPALPQKAPGTWPTLYHFSDLDIVSDRSDWTDSASMLVIKCGPPLGHRQEQAPYDYGAGHVHPDAGHFVFLSRGQFLLRDEGYSHMKLTSDHNTVLVDGRGQKGEGRMWFDFAPWLTDRRSPRILSVRSENNVDIVECDVAPAYPQDCGLTKFVRTFRFCKPHRLEIVDDLEADRPVMFEARFHLEHPAHKVSGTEYRLDGGGVSARMCFEPVKGKDYVVTSENGGRVLSLANREKQQHAQWRTIIELVDD